MNTPQKIIQTLLYEGDAMKKSEIAKFLNLSEKEIEENIPDVKTLLSTLDLNLIQNQTSLEISLSTEINTLINKNKIEELKSELSESSMQTLGVIMYKQKATKAEIDFIRGVDSSRSIKNLLTRGIIESLTEKNRRHFIPTTESLRYLNLDQVENLIDYNEVSEKLSSLINGQ
jgi:segregation and condensation protein B